jgi:predicted AlkP superfamily pyrophosphatase or phosphodiesterase
VAQHWIARTLTLLIILMSSSPAGAAAGNHVVIIAIDGFPAYLLSDPAAPIPTIRRLAAQGAVAKGLRVSNPSVTWPNHTTLVTGVQPAKHSVLFNGVLVRGEPGRPVAVDPRRDQKDLVAVPTLYDMLHAKGLRTAAINWPCTRNATTLDDNFPDVPEQMNHTTPRLRDELVPLGLLADPTDAAFKSASAPARDQIWTAAATQVIRARKPHLMLLHMLICDGIHHKYGAKSLAGYTAVALADAQVRDVLAALDEAGIRDETTIFLVSDHGFESADRILQPNVLFRKAGLMKTAAAQTTRAKAQAISEGGIAMVYLTDPATREQDRATVLELLKDQEGLAEILQPEQFASYGLPDPAKNPQMADLVLAAQPGYAFGNSPFGENFVAPAIPGVTNSGYHGFLSTNPKMNGLFIAVGNRIKPGTKLEMVDNVHIAPTAAHLLGHVMEDVDGKVMMEILMP